MTACCDRIHLILGDLIIDIDRPVAEREQIFENHVDETVILTCAQTAIFDVNGHYIPVFRAETRMTSSLMTHFFQIPADGTLPVYKIGWQNRDLTLSITPAASLKRNHCSPTESDGRSGHRRDPMLNENVATSDVVESAAPFTGL